MKKLLLILSHCITMSALTQDCEAIIIENKALKSKLATLIDTTQATRIKSFDSQFKIEVTSVTGYKENQVVDIVFMVSHAKVHQQVCLNYGTKDLQAYDEQGNIYEASHGLIGLQEKQAYGFNDYICEKVPTSIPVKIATRLRKVLPNIENIKKLIIRIGYKDADDMKSYKYATLEIDNLKITWK